MSSGHHCEDLANAGFAERDPREELLDMAHSCVDSVALPLQAAASEIDRLRTLLADEIGAHTFCKEQLIDSRATQAKLVTALQAVVYGYEVHGVKTSIQHYAKAHEKIVMQKAITAARAALRLVQP